MAESYSTTFPTTENPLSEGGIWVEGGTTGLLWTNWNVTGASVVTGTQGGSGGFDDSLAHLATWTSKNQHVKGVIFLNGGRPAGNFEIEILLRFAITANDARGYEILVSVENDYAPQLSRWSGAFNTFTTVPADIPPDVTTVTTPADGNTFEAYIFGSHIIAAWNGTLIARWTDTTYSTGKPGLGTYVGQASSTGFTGFKNAQLTGTVWDFAAAQSTVTFLDNSSGATFTVTGIPSTTAGNLLVVTGTCLAVSGTVGTLTAPAGWTVVQSAAGANHAVAFVAYNQNIGAGVTSVVITNSGGSTNYWAAVAQEYSGGAQSGGHDQTTAATGAKPLNTGNITNTNGDDLVIAVGNYDGGSGAWLDQGWPWMQPYSNDASSHAALHMIQRLGFGSTAAMSATFSNAGETAGGSALIISFKPFVAAATARASRSRPFPYKPGSPQGLR